MCKPISFVNPLSAGMHSIPAKCPICGTKQWDGITSTSEGAPYSHDPGIEDLCLDLNYGVADGQRWTTCHTACKHWFRDQTVNQLGNPGRISEAEFDQIHEAIRNSISSDHGDDVLIAMLGPGFHISNPTADALMENK